MPEPRRAIVLSDLHLGPDNGLCSFVDDAPLAAFLHHLAQDEPAFELVLAGDIFDFLQCTGYGGYDPAQAESRFDEILRAPRTARVVEGIAQVAARADVEITLLSGNHDPELLLPAVRARFEKEIGRGGVRHADDEPLVPARTEPDVRWPVYGRCLGDSHDPERAVWVLHGDRWDSTNSVDREAFLGTANPARMPKLPAGSHLVYEVLQPLKGERPWIDTLKPESAVLLLLLYLAPEAAGEFLREHLGISRQILRGLIAAKFQQGPLFRAPQLSPPAGESQDEADLGDELSALLAEDLLAEGVNDPQLLLADLDALLKGESSFRDGTFAAHGGAARWAVRAALRRIRNHEPRLFGVESDDILESAIPVVPAGLAAVVAGHTHDARAVAEGTPRYVNTGTWLPIARVPSGKVKELIDDLDEKKPWPSDSPRTFARVVWGEGAPRVALGSVDADGKERGLADV